MPPDATGVVRLTLAVGATVLLVVGVVRLRWWSALVWVVVVCPSEASETITDAGAGAAPVPIMAAAPPTPLLKVTTMADASALWCFSMCPISFCSEATRPMTMPCRGSRLVPAGD